MASLRRDVIQLLEQARCIKVREGNKHEVWRSPRSGRTFTVPRSLKSRHTASAILKQAGLPKGF